RRVGGVNAGQLESIAADDALVAVDALLAVQLAMGLPAETPTITLADSLVAPLDSAPAPAGEALRVAAAAASLRSAERTLTLAHRSVLPAPSLQAGFDQGDPTGPSGRLPVIGVSLSLPLFNRNGGEIAQATAARDRAQANLDLVGREWRRSARTQSAASPRRWHVSRATGACSRARTASRGCRSRPTPKAPSRSPTCSRPSATRARPWGATSTMSRRRTTRRPPCGSRAAWTSR